MKKSNISNNNNNNEDEELNKSSFRITVNSLKQDLYLLEKFEENKYYQDFMIEQIKQYKQEKNSNNNNNSNNSNSNIKSSDSTISPTATASTASTDNSGNTEVDIFDLILKNVNIDEIDDDYVYIREIDNDLCLKDINSTTPIYSSNNDNSNDNSNNDNSSSSNNNDSDSSSNENNIGLVKDRFKLKSSTQDDIQESNSNSNNDDDDDDDDEDDKNQENEENQIKKEIKENKKKMIRKIVELKSHDETFNEAFKFIDINKWLKTKGLDFISDNGSIEIELKECMDQLQSKINQLNNLINFNNNNNNNNNNSNINKTIQQYNNTI